MTVAIFDTHFNKVVKDVQGHAHIYENREQAEQICQDLNDQDETRETVDRYKVKPI